MQHAPVDEMHSAITITAAVPEVSCALILIAGLFLLLQGDRIGGFISKDDTQVLPAIDAERFLGLGIAIVGIWVMAVSLPVVVEHVAYRVITKNMDIHVAQLARDKAALFGSCFKFAIGLWMFFGNSGLAGIRERMRGGR